MKNWYSHLYIHYPIPISLGLSIKRYGGECGRVGSDWCANGDDFVAGTTKVSSGESSGIELRKSSMLTKI